MTGKLIVQCPVCLYALSKPAALPDIPHHWPGYQFDCRHCGSFRVDQFEYSHLLGYLNQVRVPGMPDPKPSQVTRNRAVLAHALRRMASFGSIPILLDGMTLRILQENRLPSIAEQKDNLLLWLEQEVEIGHPHWIEYENLGARVGSVSRGAFDILLESMKGEGLLSGSSLAGQGGGEFRLAPRGLERLEKIEGGGPSGNNAFMAMQYGDTALNRIVDDYFRQAVRETGFELYRLDDRPEAGLIDARLRNEIRNCRFLIADLSHANAGSYWEAGYAEGLGKPVIYTCEKSVFEGKIERIQRPHFDTNHHLTIPWESDAPQIAADMLRETIRFSIPEARQAN